MMIQPIGRVREISGARSWTRRVSHLREIYDSLDPFLLLPRVLKLDRYLDSPYIAFK
ncbi:hypothetical protein MTR_3g465610 [Medicago truncatula]|uniref:Uncharacterized protein n=1 Tax=Medicago truncatula TaxID=3880 RepID=A0A072UX72_MEDTR|nr:hypothetical protein MTR_3g465610 [Medicago truncatula]